MTNEDLERFQRIERTLEFIAGNQGRFDANQARFEEHQARFEANLQRIEEVQHRTDERLDRLNGAAGGAPRGSCDRGTIPR